MQTSCLEIYILCWSLSWSFRSVDLMVNGFSGYLTELFHPQKLYNFEWYMKISMNGRQEIDYANVLTFSHRGLENDEKPELDYPNSQQRFESITYRIHSRSSSVCIVTRLRAGQSGF
jgi:hypothetical protein